MPRHSNRRHGFCPISAASKEGRDPSVFDRADDDSLSWAVSILYSSHAKRWQRRGLPGVFETPQKRAFYREAFRLLKRSAAVELFILSLENVPIAALAAFLKNAVFYYYIGAFGPDYSRLSPGNLIILEAMRFARSIGCHVFDFLGGDEPLNIDGGARPEDRH